MASNKSSQCLERGAITFSKIDSSRTLSSIDFVVFFVAEALLDISDAVAAAAAAAGAEISLACCPHLTSRQTEAYGCAACL